MIISNSKHFIFIHIHKCGGTSISKMFEPELKWQDFMTGGSRYGEAMSEAWGNKWGLRKHATAMQIYDLVGDKLWNKYYTFSFVRHPFSRVVSLYTFTQKVVENQRWRRYIRYLAKKWDSDVWDWGSVQAYIDSDSFSEYIRHPKLKNDPAFQLQFNFISNEEGDLIVDFVGKFEDYENDVNKILENLNLKLSIPHKNKSPKKEIDITIEDRNYIADLFRTDYEMFGYEVL